MTIKTRFPVFNGLAPLGTPIALSFSLDFTGGITGIDVDFYQEETQLQIDFVQSLFADNQNSASPLILTMGGTQQRLYVPARSQATLPVFVNLPATFRATSNSGLVIPVIFLNVPLATAIWG